jgi:hypothetical protein
MKEKYIHIDFIAYEDGSEESRLDIDGLTTFELIGILTYYRDLLEIQRMKLVTKNKRSKKSCKNSTV